MSDYHTDSYEDEGYELIDHCILNSANSPSSDTNSELVALELPDDSHQPAQQGQKQQPAIPLDVAEANMRSHQLQQLMHRELASFVRHHSAVQHQELPDAPVVAEASHRNEMAMKDAEIEQLMEMKFLEFEKMVRKEKMRIMQHEYLINQAVREKVHKESMDQKDKEIARLHRLLEFYEAMNEDDSQKIKELSNELKNVKIMAEIEANHHRDQLHAIKNLPKCERFMQKEIRMHHNQHKILGFRLTNFVVPKVADVVWGSQAALMGLRAGDEIVKVNGVHVDGLQQREFDLMISGSAGPVDLTVRRGV